MKCVKLSSQVIRVSDEKAAGLILVGWTYCPKSEWKASRVVHTTKEAKLCRSM
jgi:hypothetical protein